MEKLVGTSSKIKRASVELRSNGERRFNVTENKHGGLYYIVENSTPAYYIVRAITADYDRAWNFYQDFNGINR